MNHDFTKQLQQWLQTPEEDRDYEKGALYLLQLSNNRIQYNNLVRNIKSEQNRKFIEYQLQKYTNFRVQQLTKAEVTEMSRQVDMIAKEHQLEQESKRSSDAEQGDGFKTGKRQDHNDLPDEVKALYIENLNILHRMREVHLRLRLLSSEDATCPDSERYPFLKELIELDKKYHANWKVYDHYNTQTGEVQIQEDIRTQSKNALKSVNLMKGRYKKNPSEELKAKILETLRQVINPSDKLLNELHELGVVE